MDPVTLQALLRSVADGQTTVEEATGRLAQLPYEDLGYARLDHHRTLRRGFPEVVFGPGKTPEQVAEIVRRLYEHSGHALVTRLEGGPAKAVLEQLGDLDAVYHGQARLLRARAAPLEDRGRGTVLVASAGTADGPVAEEAALCAEEMGNTVERLSDVGVAGLHRLLGDLDTLREASVLIVVAGMEGALPSVVGGLVSRPVIAVPTSTGYGAALGGLAALMGMLTSCAAGVTVVNIDNGFGAAYAASLINRVDS